MWILRANTGKVGLSMSTERYTLYSANITQYEIAWLNKNSESIVHEASLIYHMRDRQEALKYFLSSQEECMAMTMVLLDGNDQCTLKDLESLDN